MRSSAGGQRGTAAQSRSVSLRSNLCSPAQALPRAGPMLGTHGPKQPLFPDHARTLGHPWNLSVHKLEMHWELRCPGDVGCWDPAYPVARGYRVYRQELNWVDGTLRSLLAPGSWKPMPGWSASGLTLHPNRCKHAAKIHGLRCDPARSGLCNPTC